jgi:hypothetical protein
MLLRQCSQGIYVAGCAITSIATLGWMVADIHRMEKKQLQNDYEKTIKILNDEIKAQKIERAIIKMNCNK